jgi:XTP/dITP diphosphohydrolase
VDDHRRAARRLTRAPRGTNGFGYDPIFVPDGMERRRPSFPRRDKDAISHRGRAFRAMAGLIARPPAQ